MLGSLFIFFCLVVSNLANGEEEVITCPPNEVINLCANALCKIEHCKERGLPPICALVTRCEPGCNCVEGYLREKNGTCIPEHKCLSPQHSESSLEYY